MPEQYYELEIYELYTTRRRIKALSPADAASRWTEGEDAGNIDDPTYIETAEKYGRDVEGLCQDEDFTDEEKAELEKLTENGMLPALRSLRVSDNQDDDFDVDQEDC
jgi:hypothetical protein